MVDKTMIRWWTWIAGVSVSVMLVFVILSSGTSCAPAAPAAHRGPGQPEALNVSGITLVDDSYVDVYRYFDSEYGVACYVFDGYSTQGSISCLKVEGR